MAKQSANLRGKRVAALFTHGVEQVEFTEPAEALRQAGATVTVIAPQAGEIKGWNHGQWGETFQADLTSDQAKPAEFDAVLLPGGTMNADKLRLDHNAVRFVREMFTAGKPIAAICHGPWLLVEADIVRGRTFTSYPSLKTDIINAGGFWENQPVVTSDGIVTSRNPGDIPHFNEKLLEEFAEGRHDREAEAEALVNEDSFESFPASDAPGYISSTATPEKPEG
ncbi:MAG TPA: type 1 glutamine amidotransferase domain-containing protein [Thermomicrobiaceae bacterium]|nr:type 1 glutamine amidotransferase domain-containing protein [Thermomicrobiaceae bacterium]